MGVSKGTIMSRLFHARQKMQKALSDVYAEQGYANRGASGATAGERQSEPDAPADHARTDLGADDES